MDSIKQVILTPLKIIEGQAGNVMHALKATEASFDGFGEVYLSTVRQHCVKGWKKHRHMILNIIVPVGVIKFVLCDDREDSETYGRIQEITLSPDNYQRLTVPPGVWMAFQGLSEGENMLMNVASIAHDPSEAESLPLDSTLIPYTAFSL
jgi:dTDP-4-dehydrorhamnose 3,5-epimerase